MTNRLTSIIQNVAEKYFDLCGVASISPLREEADYLEKWLKKGKHGTMKYLENHLLLRTQPALLLEGAKSVIMVTKNYYSRTLPIWYQKEFKISMYAWGRDYHKVMREQMQQMVLKIQEKIGEFRYRICVDSAPLMEKVWARKAGLGWIGKNTNLIHPKKGSFFFIGGIITDLPFTEGSPKVKDYCGTCNKCIEACPTSALTPYEIDATKCISYLNIELKTSIPDEFSTKTDNWAYGCDICQQVCPWNRFSQEHQEPQFQPIDLAWLFDENLGKMSKKQFSKKISESAMERITKIKWLDNLNFLKKKGNQ